MILAELRHGSTAAEIAIKLQMPRDVVDAMVDHWTRLGVVVLTELRSGCAPGGCGGCAAATSDPGQGHCRSDLPGIR
jgi:hypothetical protein